MDAAILGDAAPLLGIPAIRSGWEGLKSGIWDPFEEAAPNLASLVETGANWMLPSILDERPGFMLDAFYSNPMVAAANKLPGINISAPSKDTLQGRALYHKDFLPAWDDLSKYGYKFTPPKINPALYAQAYGGTSPSNRYGGRRSNNLSYGRV